MKPVWPHIDYDLKHRSMMFNIAMVLLVCSHLIHFTGKEKFEAYIISFKILFIVSYLAFVINDLFIRGRVHIVTLVGRLSIIALVAFNVYLEIKSTYYSEKVGDKVYYNK